MNIFCQLIWEHRENKVLGIEVLDEGVYICNLSWLCQMVLQNDGWLTNPCVTDSPFPYHQQHGFECSFEVFANLIGETWYFLVDLTCSPLLNIKWVYQPFLCLFYKLSYILLTCETNKTSLCLLDVPQMFFPHFVICPF